MFPTELVTMGVSFLAAAATRAWQMKMEKERFMVEAMIQDNKVLDKVREGPKRGWKEFQWTRRIIALTIVAMVYVFPKLVYVITGDPTIYAWSEETGGFLWFDGSTIQHWTVLQGIAITPLDTHSASAIIGLYFGKGRT